MRPIDTALQRLLTAARAYSLALNSPTDTSADVWQRLMGELARRADEWARLDRASRSGQHRL